MSDLEREKFEKWVTDMEPAYAASNLERLTGGRGGYRVHNVAIWWMAWLARSESAPTRESLHAEWMAQEKYLDWSNFLLHKLTGQAAPSDLRRAWEDGRDAALKVAEQERAVGHDEGGTLARWDACDNVVNGIRALGWPGESAPAPPQMIDFAAQTVECKECGWTGQFRSIWEHFVSKHPALGEAGSPAPAPTEEK